MAEVDWSKWYLTEEEDIGQSPEQDFIIVLLRACIQELARERGWKHVLVGADAFFGWVRDQPSVQVSPDVYLLDNPPRIRSETRSWQTWKPGVNPPRFAVEVVSVNWKKDLVDAPDRYAQLGCKELVIFDPTKAGNSKGPRRALTVYRREADGLMALVDRGDGPVWSKELDAWLVIQDIDGLNRLRIARNAEGTDLVPTASERAETAEARIAALEAELKKRSR